MLPREHGSWAVLIAPILVGLALTRGGPPLLVALFLCAAFGAFLARVPLQALASKNPAPGAGNWLAAYAGLACAGGLPLLASFGRWGLLAFALPAGAIMAWSLKTRAMTLSWELLGILGLCLGAPALSYVVRGGMGADAWLAWLACALFFCGPVFHVKLAALQHRAAGDRSLAPALLIMRRKSLAYHALALTLTAAAASAEAVPKPMVLPFAAALLKTWRRAGAGPARVDFQRLGYSEVGFSCFFVLCAGAGYLL